MAKFKVMPVYGTRPEAVKLAPVIRALIDDDRFETIPVSTGQHKEMLEQVNEMFQIMPAFDLGLMKVGQGLNGFVSRTLTGLDPVLEKVSPDVLLVQGDTSTAMASALAGFHRGIKVVHLEAGLRTGDKFSPFPEEVNRSIISKVASLHLAPTESTSKNLESEGICPDDIFVTGNTVIDALLDVAGWEADFSNPILEKLVEVKAKKVVVTTHRRENLGFLKDIGGAIQILAKQHPSVNFILPLHLNPAVREVLVQEVQGIDNIVLTEPLRYDEFTKLVASSMLILTDSGGVQEEAPSLGTPVLVMRDNTERPEGVAAGAVRLVGTQREGIVCEANRLLSDPIALHEMLKSSNPYGDGKAALRTVSAIGKLLGIGERMPPFVSK